MALREIIKKGDPVLEKHCHPVTRFDQKLWDLLDDMRETLAQANGLGLAAPQVGILRRAVLVVNDQEEMLELINPEIIASEGEEDGLEGCLSVPGYWGYVKRPAWVKVRAHDRNGNEFETEGTGMTARCFCHELAHLDGQLYTDLADRITPPRSWTPCWRSRGNDDSLYGYPGFRCPVPRGADCRRTHHLRRIHPAGPAEKQGNEAPGTTCKADSPCT